MAITKGLEKRISNYTLDTKHEWSPAATQTKTNINGDTAAYLRGKPTDHKAQKVTLHLDLVENGPSGNRAIINYNNRDGWKKYYKVSDKYAKPIMATVRIFKDKNDLQREFKKIMHEIGIECFGIKYKKCKQTKKKLSKRKHEVVKELSEIVKEHKKEELDTQDKIKSHKSLQMKIRVVDEVIRGPKHKARERTALFDPKTSELLTDENEILEATLQYNIGVLTKNKVAKQDLPEVEKKPEEHERIMKGNKKWRNSSISQRQAYRPQSTEGDTPPGPGGKRTLT